MHQTHTFNRAAMKLCMHTSAAMKGSRDYLLGGGFAKESLCPQAGGGSTGFLMGMAAACCLDTVRTADLPC